MSLFTEAVEIEKKFAWSFIGVCLGAIGLFLTLWLFWKSKENEKADLNFYIDNKVNLIEIRDTLPSLRILINDDDILKSNNNVEIITITIQNDGRDILQNHYDQNEDFAITALNKKILAVKIVETNSVYLAKNLIGVPILNTLPLNKVIIDKGKFIRFRMYVIGSPQPEKLFVSGKIAGIDKLKPSLRSPDFLTKNSHTITSLFLGILASIFSTMLAQLSKPLRFKGKGRAEKESGGQLD